MATESTSHLFSLAPPPQVLMEGDSTEPAADSSSNAPWTVAITDPGLDLAKKTVCIKVRLSTMGNTRKVSTSQIEADADKDLLRVSKRLVDSAELKAITRFDGEIRRFLYNICLPFEIGIHLLPIAALETVEHRLRQFAEDRRQLVEAFLSAYPSLCQDAAKRLRGLYNPADYPRARRSRTRVRLLVAVRQLRRAGPTQRHLTGSLGAGAREGRAAHGRSVIRNPGCAAGVDGKARPAHGRPAEGRTGWQAAALQGDHRIEPCRVPDELRVPQRHRRQRTPVAGLAGSRTDAGRQADDLRTTGDLRTKVQQGMTGIAGQLDTMLTRTGGRKFRFDEEE